MRISSSPSPVAGRPRLRRARPPSAAEAEDIAAADYERRPRDYVREGAPQLRGARTLTGILPNGRVLWLRVDPRPAPLGELNRLVHIAGRVGDRQDAAALEASRSLRRMARALEAETARLGRERQRCEKRLQADLSARRAKLDKRITEEFGKNRVAMEKERERELVLLKRLGRRSLWDTLVVVSALPLFAAFGQRKSPFGANNVTLFLSLVVWLLGDEITDLLSSNRDPEGMGFLRDSDIWSYVAPFANLLTGWFLLRGTQNQRFVTGTAGELTFVGAETIAIDTTTGTRTRVFSFAEEIDLGPSLAPDFVAEFQSFEQPPAVATVMNVEWASPATTSSPGTTSTPATPVTPVTTTVTPAPALALRAAESGGGTAGGGASDSGGTGGGNGGGAAQPRIVELLAEVTEGVLLITVRIEAVESVVVVGDSVGAAAAAFRRGSAALCPVLFTSLNVAWIVDTKEP